MLDDFVTIIGTIPKGEKHQDRYLVAYHSALPEVVPTFQTVLKVESPFLHLFLGCPIGTIRGLNRQIGSKPRTMIECIRVGQRRVQSGMTIRQGWTKTNRGATGVKGVWFAGDHLVQMRHFS
jgi:hypothetical protein